MTTYITFGQSHTHRVNGHTLDCDCVAAIESNSEGEGRERAFALMGNKWCFSYQDKKPDMSFFPRGVIWIDGDKPAEQYEERINDIT